jgi:hypothetical protein
MHSLCCAPSAIDLEPEKNRDDNKILVEKVANPVEGQCQLPNHGHPTHMFALRA